MEYSLAYEYMKKISHCSAQSFENPAFLDAMHSAKANDKALHLFALCSDGGVHSHINHFLALAEMAKRHNNANMLAFGARITPVEDVLKMVDIWLNAAFEEGRHQRRIDLIEM